MYQNIGGIKRTGVAYKTFDIAPSIGGSLTGGKGAFESVYGTIRSEWEQQGNALTLNASVPVNTTATVTIPAIDRYSVLEGGVSLDRASGVTIVSEGDGRVVVEVGSGDYSFSVDPAHSGLVVEIIGAEDTLPGVTVQSLLRVTNTGSEPVTGFVAGLSLSGSLVATPTQVAQQTLAAGASLDLPFSVMIPAATAPGAITVTADVSATVGGDARHYQITQKLFTVLPALQFQSVSTAVEGVESPEVATVSAVVENAAVETITGRFVVDVPGGWPVPAPSRLVRVKPGGTASADTVVAIPVTVTQEEAPLSVRFVHEETTLATAFTAATVSLETPPSGFTDHVDFGDVASETAHNVTTSGHGGRSTEAGLTRRYSGLNNVGSWFGADFAVTSGEPFVIRGIETYDQSQFKSYDILVNDVLIEERLYQRNAGGAGLVTFQVLIPDDGTLTSAGTVNVKFRFNGKGSHDPSMADVWTLDVPADTVAPSVTHDVSNPGNEGWHLEGAAVTLDAIDARSGVASIEYKTQDTPWTAYSGEIALEEGITEFSYRATDNAGNVSGVRTEQLRVDATHPDTWGWLATEGHAVSVTRDGGSGVSNLEYSADGSTWLPSLTHLLSGVSAQSLDSLHLRATDLAGNTSEVLNLDPQEESPLLTASPGEDLVIHATGFAAGDRVRAELHSDPVVLATTTADAFGVIEMGATVPASVLSGDHHLVFVVESGDNGGGGGGGNSDGPGGSDSDKTLRVPIKIGERLSTTGTETGLILWLAVALLGLGTTVYVVRSMRRRNRVNTR
ncbi:alpha-L-rhamnosidase C-terminal domain-containing protein [Lysinibacter sp. HNR]|uniref:OmpL47-type beta-barrel domain-containing protein n=1 Tax=Lysinibacter sp. HNR TaxID=3031408 RepID=UPI002434F656|nr:alpha-L-rhamnosidase C-terminal domain-containing protein [Lysinibacter sp. HNR]WGD38575.1 alpha-L-rhamnosidase C-terminal domain-containing protein [Lysinibacter sp. HNR]